MSNTKKGRDCCGDRYACDANIMCHCGCELWYCNSCYETHMCSVAEILLKKFTPAQRKKLLAKEIKEQREEYDNEDELVVGAGWRKKKKSPKNQ